MNKTFLYTIVYNSWSDDDNYSHSSGFFGSNMFYIVMGVALLALAAWLIYSKFYRYSLLKKSCTVPVEARIFSVDSKFGGKGGRYWNVTYEFFYNERRYIANNDYWEQARYHRPIEGNVVTIMINPYNPNEYYDAILNHARGIGIFSGVLIAGCAIMLMLMPLFVK